MWLAIKLKVLVEEVSLHEPISMILMKDRADTNVIPRMGIIEVFEMGQLSKTDDLGMAVEHTHQHVGTGPLSGQDAEVEILSSLHLDLQRSPQKQSIDFLWRRVLRRCNAERHYSSSRDVADQSNVAYPQIVSSGTL